jgi:cytochrome c-type biogenesis protein CcmH/NrfG
MNDGAAGGMRARLVEIRKIEKSEGLPAAENALVDLLREGPQTHQGFIALARVLMKQRRFDDALRSAQKAQSIAPLEADTAVAVGLANLRLRDNPAAARAFAEALRLNPNDARANLGAAAVKLVDESYDDAMELCEKVLDIDPTMERAHELVARIAMKKGDKGQAIGELELLVRTNPENQRALRAYVRLMRAEGRIDEVLAFLESQADAHPHDERRAGVLARVGARLGKAEYATEYYERLREDGEVRIPDKVRYAMALIQAGDFDGAGVIIAELDTQKILKPVVATLHGEIAWKKGDHDEAVRLFQTACRTARVDPLDPAVEAGATDPAGRARLWRGHARKSIMTAARGLRAARD